MKRTREEVASSFPPVSSGRGETKLAHPFKANFNDHFETSVVSLRDIYPFLDELRQVTRPSCPEAFTLYDPYYCTGKVKEAWKLSEFGINRVIHENRDFYQDIKNGIAPPMIVRDEVENFITEIGDKPAPFDVCVTNPPFSDNHIERFLLEFALPSKKPWAMLVPDYIANKQWFVKIVETYYTPAPIVGRNANFDKPPVTSGGNRMPAGLSLAASIPRMDIPMMPFAEEPPTAPANEASSEGADGTKIDCDEKKDGNEGVKRQITIDVAIPVAKKEVEPPVKQGQEPFYIVPKTRYEFDHPVQAGRERSHFKSLWIVSAGRRTAELLKSVKTRADPSKVSIASGRLDLTRQTALPGQQGSAALIPNPPKRPGSFHGTNNGGLRNSQAKRR